MGNFVKRTVSVFKQMNDHAASGQRDAGPYIDVR